MAISRETLRLAARMRAQLDDITDAQTRDLVRAWAEAWDEVAPDLQDALLALTAAADGRRVTRGMVRRSARLQNALAVIAEALQTLAGQTGVRIVGDLDDVVRQAGEAQAAIIGSQLPATEQAAVSSWDRVDPEQIAAIVGRSTEQITALSWPLAPDAYQAVRRELVRGIAAGSNPRDTARRMVQRVEGRFNGGLTRALVIARTETLDAHREAARVGQEANADVLAGWRWGAKLDGRTCPACWSMHGRLFEVVEPGPLGHQQCRCARIPKSKSWADLGIEGVEEPPDLLPDAQAEFDRLPAAEQAEILGPKRYEAWLAGEFPFGEWATRRRTDGWRDSYVMAKAPAGGGGRGGGATGSHASGRSEEPDPKNLGDTLSTRLVGAETRRVVRQAVDMIAKVHGVDATMPRLPVLEISEEANDQGMQRLGSYAFAPVDPKLNGPADRFAQSVALSVNLLDVNKTATLIHELGHFLDHKGLGSDSERFASTTDPLLNGWRQAVKGSEAFQLLMQQVKLGPGEFWTVLEDADGRQVTWNPDLEHVLYLLDPRETFARSYAQWIALRSGDTELLDEVMSGLVIPKPPAGFTLTAGSLPPGHPSQWAGEDFTPIAEAFDELFDSLGLLRRDPG